MSQASLQGQVALVAGGSRRTGRDMALTLARAGATVHITFHQDHAAAQATASELQAITPGAAAWSCTAENEQDVDATVRAIIYQAGRIDVLVNAVGAFQVKPIDQVTVEEWRHVLECTVTATFLMCRAVLPGMAARGYGRVVNIADSGADLLLPAENDTAYMVGKTGVLILTKSLAKKYAAQGVTVNAVSPGILENSITKPALKSIPTGRYTPTRAVTDAVLFLADPKTQDITGANLKVGGGWNM